MSRVPEPWRWPLLLLAGWVLLVTPWVAGFPHLWDDHALLVGGRLADPLSALPVAWTRDFWQLAWPVTTFESGMYRPFLATSFVLDAALPLPWPVAGHVVNVILHASVATLTGVLATRLGARPLLPTGLLLVHPFAAELVGIVSNRSDLLATLLAVGSVLAWDAGRRPLALLLCLLAGLTKEVALVTPGLWALVDHDRGRRPWAAAWGALPLAAVFLARALALDAQPSGFSPLEGLRRTGAATLLVLVPDPSGPAPAPLAPGLGWAGLGVSAALAAWRPTRFAALWVILAFAPMAGWVGEPAREARGLLYLPLVGVAAAAGRWVAGLGAGPGRMLVVALLLVLGALQGRVLHFHADAGRFWSWAALENPDSPRMRYNHGAWLDEAGDPAGARREFMEAAARAQAARDPQIFVYAATALGRMAEADGDVAAAQAYYADAVGVAGPEMAPDAAAGLGRLGR